MEPTQRALPTIAQRLASAEKELRYLSEFLVKVLSDGEQQPSLQALESQFAEGLRRTENGWTDGANGYDATSARMAFRELWESIYGEASWDENPWVWVAEWKEIEVSR